MLSEGYSSILHNSVMNATAIRHQANCHDCQQVAPHFILNKAIIRLSNVYPARGPMPLVPGA